MVAILAKKTPLGTKAFDFKLNDVTSNQPKTLKEIQSDHAAVVMFIRNKCPYVEHILNKLVALAEEYISKGVSFVAINSNDPTMYPDDTAEKMQAFAKTHSLPFPYLDDPTQVAAKGFGASCTPDFFVFDKDLQLVYHGQFDSARPENDHPVTGDSLKSAFDALLANEQVKGDQPPSYGCRIKWRS